MSVVGIRSIFEAINAEPMNTFIGIERNCCGRAGTILGRGRHA